MRRLAWGLVLVWILSPAHGDVESAQYFVSRARKALAADKLEEAGRFLEKSLAEKAGFAPAHFVYADLEQRRGRTGEAVRHLEACVEQGGREGAGAEEREAAAIARKRLAALDRPRAEWRTIVDDYVASLLDLADRSKKKNPELAQACLRRILQIRPDDPEAQRRLGALTGGGEAPEERGIRLWNGKDLSNWTGDAPVWTVKDKILTGTAGTGAYWNRVKGEVKGDFTLVCEMRVIRNTDEDPLFGITFAAAGPYSHYGLWLWPEGWRLEQQKAEHERGDLERRNIKRLGARFDRYAWHTYRIVARGGKVCCYVNGRKLFDHKFSDRSLDGFVGLWIQDCTVEVRRFVRMR